MLITVNKVKIVLLKPSDSTTDEKDDSNNKVHDTNASTRNATTDDSEESVIDKLDKIQQDFKSDSNNKLSEQRISKHHHLIKRK